MTHQDLLAGPPPTLLPEDEAALELMRFMSDFREAMWGVVQGADIVGQFGRQHHRRARLFLRPFPAFLELRKKQLREFSVNRMAGTRRDDVRLERQTQQHDVADDIEDLVTDEFVGPAQSSSRTFLARLAPAVAERRQLGEGIALHDAHALAVARSAGAVRPWSSASTHN